MRESTVQAKQKIGRGAGVGRPRPAMPVSSESSESMADESEFHSDEVSPGVRSAGSTSIGSGSFDLSCTDEPGSLNTSKIGTGEWDSPSLGGTSVDDGPTGVEGGGSSRDLFLLDQSCGGRWGIDHPNVNSWAAILLRMRVMRSLRAWGL